MQNDIFKFNKDQRQAYDNIMNGDNVFLTGQAGTGKSYLLQAVCTMYEAQGKNVAVTSTTGVSALLIKGTTIHRWSGIGLGDKDATTLLKKVKRSRAAKNWKEVTLLIIDEISMMPPDLFDKLEYIARAMRQCSRPFGGIQLIICGDFCQLPPVPTDVYCYKANTWNDCITKIAYLKENMRQENREFQEALAEIRLGRVTEKTINLLNTRINANVKVNGILPTKLFSRRMEVDDINSDNMKILVTPENPIQRYRAKDIPTVELNAEQETQNKAYVDKACQARRLLDLVIGAQVMLICNLDIDMGLVNGSRGVVIRFEEHRPVVLFVNGIELIIAAHTWDIEVSEYLTISRIQIPLILAWACTIHKAQGSTLDCAEMDLGDSIFAPGQFYTALSRVRGLEYLCITDIDYEKVIAHHEVVELYENLDRLSESINRIKLE